MNHLAVFCGSQFGTDPAYATAAADLGLELARRGVTLVYGGGRVGLMGVVAAACVEAGGAVVGVIPEFLAAKEIAFTAATELHVVATMHQRKAIMADRADAVAVLPGGFGTMDELFEILTWAQLGLHAKPVVLLNVNGFFDPLLAWVDHLTAEGFVHARHRNLLLTADGVPDLFARLDRRGPDVR